LRARGPTRDQRLSRNVRLAPFRETVSMDIRVTPQVSISRSIAIARQHSSLLSNFQQQVATGNRLFRASDDPLATMTVLTNKAQLQKLDSHLGNVSDARTSLNVGVSALQDSVKILSTARQVAIEGGSSGNSPTAMEALAQEVDSLINRLFDVTNTQNAGRYQFSGAATETPPFRIQSTTPDGKPTRIVYQGSDHPAQELIAPSRTTATLYPGSEVFQFRERGATVFSGQTGAAPGSGTDSATGQGTLLVRHTLTTYAAGSGIAVGTSSVNGDTIIGPAGAHQININDTSGTGASGVISLDGGPPIAFSNADTNLRVSGPSGDVVYVNTTAITAGFNGNVSITADGTLSVDGGATSAAINFAANQIVTDGATGAVTNVNSIGIRRTGTEGLDYTGTYDTFEVLIALRDDLRNTRGLDSTAQIESISARVGELERVHRGLLNAVGEQSVALENLDSLQTRIEDVRLETQKLTSELESADVSEAVLGLQNQQSMLQLTFASAARIFDQSLLDFLR
jgi:flagellar hook-associated protein 3 FlgL